jgi:hypothetical protein
MVLETVFILVLWNGIGSARGDYFSQARMLSEHSTEQKCDAALAEYGRKLETETEMGRPSLQSPVISCVRATHIRKITGSKPPT